MSELAQLRDRIDPVDDRPRLDDVQRATFDKITPKQREVLRLALIRKSSKEIARELGIAARSVDQRLDAARITLGVTTRFEAARKFYDLLCASERLTSDPFMLGDGGVERRGESGEQSLYVFGDALQFSPHAVWEGSAEADQGTWRRFVPGLPSAASGSGDRIMWIVIGAMAILALVLLGLGVVEGLERLIGGG